jgi:glycosidase
MFSAFDLEYDYDIREVFDRYLKGECRLSNYMDMLNFQECLYPQNYNKMRCLENHDQPRISSFVKDDKALENFTAFLYFLKGSTLLYAGQEFKNTHVPSLFEKDLILREENGNISTLLQKLYHIKKKVLSCEDYFSGTADDAQDIAILCRDDNQTCKLGVFSLKAKAADVKVAFPDGTYVNHLDGNTVVIQDGMLHCNGNPIILTKESM